MNRKTLLSMILLLGLVVSWVACGKSVQGTYSDNAGAFVLELKSGGKATFTFGGEAMPCTYKVDGNQVTLQCATETNFFTVHDDGSLTGPPGSFMGALRKTKS